MRTRVIVLLALLVAMAAGCAQLPAPAGTSPAGTSSAPGPGSGAPVASPRTPTAKGDVPVIGLTYIPNIQFAPWYVAADKGLFAAAGTDVTLRHHGAQEGLFTALAAGNEQLVVAGGDEMLQARQDGLDLVAVAQVYTQYPVKIIVPVSSSVQSVADLKGRKVGVPGRYGESWMALVLGLRVSGLTEADVTVVEIGYTQQAALATGKVDAVVGFVNNDVVAFSAAGVAVRSIPLGDGVHLQGISLITTRAYAATHPSVVKAVATATVKGMQQVAADQPAAITLSSAHVPGLTDATAKATATAVLAATVPLYGPPGHIDGRMQPDGWSAMSRSMFAAGLLKVDVDGATVMTNEYLG